MQQTDASKYGNIGWYSTKIRTVHRTTTQETCSRPTTLVYVSVERIPPARRTWRRWKNGLSCNAKIRICTKSEWVVFLAVIHPLFKFHVNLFSSFWTILQSNQPTNGHGHMNTWTHEHNLVGGGNDIFRIVLKSQWLLIGNPPPHSSPCAELCIYHLFPWIWDWVCISVHISNNCTQCCLIFSNWRKTRSWNWVSISEVLPFLRGQQETCCCILYVCAGRW